MSHQVHQVFTDTAMANRDAYVKILGQSRGGKTRERTVTSPRPPRKNGTKPTTTDPRPAVPQKGFREWKNSY